EELFFTIDEKSQEADLSEQGRSFMNPDDPNAFVLPDLISEFTEIDLNQSLSDEEKEKQKGEKQQHCDAQAERIHNISQLLRAYCLFEKDVQYVVEENKVVIVDEYTGRKMPGRRWSDGLHQAVEASELLSRMLKREKIPHNMLNAKYHMQEAEIVARAGQPGTVTISTNMAGRGTDIKLGSSVADRGGLYVIGTERHESRRID